MKLLIPQIIGWVIIVFLGLLFLFAGFLFFVMASDSGMPILCILGSLLCIGGCVWFVAGSEHRKFLGSLVGTCLFALGSWGLYLAMTLESSNRDEGILNAAGFMALYGLPGLYYVFKYRFQWLDLKPDLNKITELLDSRLALAVSNSERLIIMAEILQNYEAYHRREGGDEATWSRIASILEEDYEIYETYVHLYRRDYEQNPINHFSITPLVRELAVGGPVYPMIQGDSRRVGVDWKASFRGTLSELLGLEQKRYRESRSDIRFLLWTPLFLGILWGISAVFDFRYRSLLLFWALPVYLQAIYADLIRPMIVRRQIHKNFPAHGDIEIEVSPDGFLYRNYGSGVSKTWDDLSDAGTAKFGIELRWKDGTQHWLPQHLAD